jgi:hypothetical protein
MANKTFISIFALVLAVVALAMPASAQMCSYTGNVDYTASHTEGNVSSLTFEFKNHNDYTVDARFTVVSVNGTSKTQTRTFVMEAGGTHSEKFTCNLFGGANISASDTSVSYTVRKCD